MTSISELSPARVAEFKAAIRRNQHELKVARNLMLDLLAKAYESDMDEDTYIHPKYYDYANDILSLANSRDDRLYKAIMKKEGLI